MWISVYKFIDFFYYNTDHPEEPAYLYRNFHQNPVFVDREQKWKLRERQFAIGKMYHVNPISGKQFYLRLLLTVVLSPKLYENLRTVNDTVYDTFYKVCVAWELLEDD